jgi:uncharacterized membrane-anchored protein YjiN (DUF445 family)
MRQALRLFQELIAVLFSFLLSPQNKVITRRIKKWLNRMAPDFTPHTTSFLKQPVPE